MKDLTGLICCIALCTLRYLWEEPQFRDSVNLLFCLRGMCSIYRRAIEAASNSICVHIWARSRVSLQLDPCKEWMESNSCLILINFVKFTFWLKCVFHCSVPVTILTIIVSNKFRTQGWQSERSHHPQAQDSGSMQHHFQSVNCMCNCAT